MANILPLHQIGMGIDRFMLWIRTASTNIDSSQTMSTISSRLGNGSLTSYEQMHDLNSLIKVGYARPAISITICYCDLRHETNTKAQNVSLAGEFLVIP